jgi:hypothetical protein
MHELAIADSSGSGRYTSRLSANIEVVAHLVLDS